MKVVTLTRVQEEGVSWMAAREALPGPHDPLPNVRGGVLADEMGVGKTHTVAALMARHPKPTLVVATIATLDHWVDTLRAHGLRPCCVMSRDHASTLGTGIVQNGKTVVTIVSALAPGAGRCSVDPPAIAEMFSRAWGRVVLDEAHVIRNPVTQVHKTMLRLNAAHKWAVTGTPIQNRERDLQSLGAWLGAVGLPASVIVKHLVIRRCLPSPQQYDVDDDNDNDDNDNNDNNDDMKLRKSVSTPPPMVRHDVQLEFAVDSDEAAIYAAVSAACRLPPSGDEGDDDGGDGGEDGGTRGTGECEASLRFQNPMTPLLRCRQAASHPRALVAAAAAAMRRVRDASPTEAARLPAVVRALARLCASGSLDIARIDPSFGTKSRWVVRDLEEAADADGQTRSIVFCDWIDQMEDLRAALVDARPDTEAWLYHGTMTRTARRAVIQEFSATSTPSSPSSSSSASSPHPVVMFIQVQCGALGLNLQAANRVYILGPQWNPTVEMQAIGRAHRLGQTRPVHVLHVCVRDTVDTHVVKVQHRKLSDISVIMGVASISVGYQGGAKAPH